MKIKCYMFIFILFIPITSVSSLESLFKAQRLSDGSYFTTGTVILSITPDRVSAVLEDFAHYYRWALKGLDGKDPVSRKHMGIFKNVIFREKARQIVLIYDVNLIWPFGSKNNEFPLNIISMKYRNGHLKSYTLTFTESGPTIKSMLITLSIDGNHGSSILKINCTTDFTWLVDTVINTRIYKKSIADRIIQLANNIEKAVHQ